MTIKDRIIKVLKKKGLSFNDLVKEINANENSRHYTETEADKLIENMDSGFLEKISKILRIPLYSFHRENDKKKDYYKPYYNENIWKDDENNEDNKKN